MKIRHLIFIIALALNFCFLAQTEFTPGLYLVKKGATYAQEVKNNSIYYPYSPKNPSSYGKHTEMAPSDELVVTTENGEVLSVKQNKRLLFRKKQRDIVLRNVCKSHPIEGLVR